MKNKITSITILYGIPNCNSMAKARDYLSSNKIEYVEVNLKKTPFSAQDVAEILRVVPITKFVNTKGPTYRNWAKESGKDITKIPVPEAIEAIIASQSMIKRPFITNEGKYYVGLDEMEQVR